MNFFPLLNCKAQEFYYAILYPISLTQNENYYRKEANAYVELTSFTFTSLKPISTIRYYAKTISYAYGLIGKYDSEGVYLEFQ